MSIEIRRGIDLTEATISVYEQLSRRRVMIAFTVLPALILFTFTVVLPVAWAVITSLFNVPLYASNPANWTWAGIQNYVELLPDPSMWGAIWRGVLFASGSVVFQLTVGIGLALLINKPFKNASAIRAIVLVPYLIPTAAIAFIGLWMANSSWGIINQLLVQWGLIKQAIPWYTSESLAMISIILTSSWKFTIFVTLMVLARLQGIPENYYEAATIAGASTVQKFRDITLPNLKGVIFIVLLLRGVWMFNKFDIIWILTEGGPGQRTTTLPIYAFQLAFTTGELSQANTVATIMFVMLAVVAIIYFVTLNPAEEVRVE